MGKARLFRDLLERPGAIVVPGVFDALSAKIAERAGFDAVFMSGFGATASVLGKPDLAYMTLTEAATHAGNIANAVKIPVFADVDTGFGGPLNVARTVVEFEARGVAGIQIEDQAWPKRCNLVEGATVLPRHEYISKIKAAVRAKEDPDFVIIARVDAYGTMGFQEVVDRANAAVDAGADMVFAASESRWNREDLARKIELIKAPQVRSFVRSHPGGLEGSTDDGTLPGALSESAAEGFKLLVLGISPMLVAARAITDFLHELKETGELSALATTEMSWDEFDDLIGQDAAVEELAELERVDDLSDVAV